MKLSQRRLVFFLLVTSISVGMFYLLYEALAVGGIDAMDVACLLLFTCTLAWTAIGTAHAIIALVLMRRGADALSSLMPEDIAQAANSTLNTPLTSTTALLLCIRNENPEPIIRNLTITLTGLYESAQACNFHVYILSDSTDRNLITAEAQAFEQLSSQWAHTIGITYRRRAVNTGYKAGNVHDFCVRWGDQHEFALVLDADSFMAASAIIRLVRMIQANPKLGLLQGLVVALPSTSAFTRIFQFGMRLGMRSWALGSAWWQGDCGPYWGHNAVFRVAPFRTECELPLLKPNRHGARHILSHDQIEAVLMRRAGFEVRVLPLEDKSWEQNPPTLPEFVARDLRWCEGNMQYASLLGMPGLKFVSRLQLLLAMLMFIGAPAWVGLISLITGLLSTHADPGPLASPTFGLLAFFAALVFPFLPKIVTVLAVLSNRSERLAFGGAPRFLLGFIVETAFSLMICPIMWLTQTIFLCRLALGKSRGWVGQTRDDHTVSWHDATRQFWPHTLFGLTCILLIFNTHPGLLPYALLFLAGPALVIPLAVLSSWPDIGLWMVRTGLAQLPEETAPPEELMALDLAALRSQATKV